MDISNKHFLDELVIQSKLTLEEVLKSIEITNGFITKITLSTSFRKIKKMPCFSTLKKLQQLSLCEDTFAKSKKWLLKNINIKSNSLLDFKISVSNLKRLSLSVPNLIDLKVQVDHLDQLEVEMMNKLIHIEVNTSGEPFEKWRHNPENVETLKIYIRPDRLREEKLFDPIELPLISNYNQVEKLWIDGREVEVQLEVNLKNHQKLEYLNLYGGGSISIIGNMTSLLAFSISEHTADSSTLHNYVESYNWDNGVLPLTRIVKSNNCSEDTAKLIYWLAKPTWFLQYLNDEQVNETEKSTCNLIRLIESEFKKNRIFKKTSFNWKAEANPYPELPKLRNIPKYMYSDHLI